MSCLFLKECILPETSESLRNWILYTNYHHNSHRTHDETVATWKDTKLGEYIDFNKMNTLMRKHLNLPEINITPALSFEGSKKEPSLSTLVNKFFGEIERLKKCLKVETNKEDVWPFGYESECDPKDCYKRKDGLWKKLDRINTHSKNKLDTYGYDVIFLWRVMPNYCTWGRPVCTSDRIQAFLEQSETEKLIISYKGYEFLWKWDTVILPTENVWGMKMGKTFFEFRQTGMKPIKEYTKTAFKQKIKEWEALC